MYKTISHMFTTTIDDAFSSAINKSWMLRS